MHRLLSATLAAALLAPLPAAAQSRAVQIKDADTRAWWATTKALSSDEMEGRDTGSPGHAKAARLVARRFAKAGLKPAGDNGTWFQEIPLHEVAVTKAGTRFALVRDIGGEAPLAFLHDISIRPADDMPGALDAPLAFRGYCAPADMTGVTGKIAVCFNTRRAGLTTAAQRARAAQEAGAVGIIQVDDPHFTIEPHRWPQAYARTLTFADAKPAPTGGFVAMTLSAKAFETMLDGSGQDAKAILDAGGAKQPLPAFEIPARLRASLTIDKRDYMSANVLGVLPGTDPTLAPEHVVLIAHLDGYGHGEPVAGDGLYNGALDDAAYVALLTQLADRRKGKGYKRSVLFAAVTGEEKGLLGSRWYVSHPTRPIADTVAVLNLDQLRPLYPLKILTTLAVDDTSLGATARKLAPAGVEVRPDLEPERGLITRSDHWPFMQAGVPGISFIFGFDPGTEAEARYREWYQTRYHRPQDDIGQPMDFEAARDFNAFWYSLVEAVANDPVRPSWTTGSPLAQRQPPAPKPAPSCSSLSHRCRARR